MNIERPLCGVTNSTPFVTTGFQVRHSWYFGATGAHRIARPSFSGTGWRAIQRMRPSVVSMHPMAPWFYEKTDHYLKEFKVVGAKAAPLGTIVVETSEDNFRVEEKGMAEGEMASYLVGRKEGVWHVVDKKHLETFPADSVKIGYKGYFDKVQKVE